jgi:chromosome segregation ATPase
MEQILARLMAKMNAMQERMEAKMDTNQEKMDAKMDANQEIMADLKTQIGCIASRIEVNQGKTEAWLGEMKAWRKGTTSCQEATEACLEKAKANPEKMKTAVDIFRERLDNMDTADLDANPEEKETVAEQQEVPVEVIGALKDPPRHSCTA